MLVHTICAVHTLRKTSNEMQQNSVALRALKTLGYNTPT
jgi:hypothetical protein